MTEPAFSTQAGLATLGPELVALRAALDATFLRWAAEHGAAPMLFPSLMRVEDLDRFEERRHKRVVGTRRPLRVQLKDPDVEGGVDEHGSYVRVAFDLPRGAFATTVLREIMKPELVGLASPAAHDADD